MQTQVNPQKEAEEEGDEEADPNHLEVSPDASGAPPSSSTISSSSSSSSSSSVHSKKRDRFSPRLSALSLPHDHYSQESLPSPRPGPRPIAPSPHPLAPSQADEERERLRIEAENDYDPEDDRDEEMEDVVVIEDDSMNSDSGSDSNDDDDEVPATLLPRRHSPARDPRPSAAVLVPLADLRPVAPGEHPQIVSFQTRPPTQKVNKLLNVLPED